MTKLQGLFAGAVAAVGLMSSLASAAPAQCVECVRVDGHRTLLRVSPFPLSLRTALLMVAARAVAILFPAPQMR